MVRFLSRLLAGQFENRFSISLPFGGFFSSPTETGETVDIDRALGVTTVLACVRVIAEGLAQVPFRLFQETDSGRGMRIAREHPVDLLIGRRPNGWMRTFQWREQMVLHAALTGNGFSVVHRMGGEPVELLPVQPGRVSILRESGYRLQYQVTPDDGGEPITVAPEDMFHLRGPMWDWWQGINILDTTREAIGLARATERSHARFHRNGSRPSGVLSVEGLSKEAVDRLQNDWTAFTGVDSVGKVPVIPGGARFYPISLTGVDAQHIETRRYQVEEICRGFRVFPLMVMHADKTATFASSEQFFQAHVIHTLGPWTERFEQEADRALLTEREIRSGFQTKLQMRGLMRGDAKSRGEFYKALAEVCAIVPNEIRFWEELPALDGLDDPFAPLNKGFFKNGRPVPTQE